VVTLVEYNKAKTTQGSELASAQMYGKAAALAADVLYGTGAAAFVTGLILTLTAPSSSPGTAVSAAPIDRGGLVVVSGRF
jgi:hypothetical protein